MAPAERSKIVAQDGEQTTILAAQGNPAQADRQPQALLRGKLDHAVAFDRGALPVVLADRAPAQDAQRHIAFGPGPLAFVGSGTLARDVTATAATIKHQLRFDVEERRGIPTWAEALRRFIEQTDALGVLVMVNGVVASNTHRRLDPNEFRGFALADPLAPLVFINGADTKAVQMFTLVHELAHIWLGESALSDVEPVTAPTQQVEAWCNWVAAELLVPLELVRQEYRREEDLRGALDRLARYFKVSTLVILRRRIHDAGGMTRDQLREAYYRDADFDIIQCFEAAHVCHQKDVAAIFENFLTEWCLISTQITGSGDSVVAK